MPTFAIALMGFIAFSGGPTALPEEVPAVITPAEDAHVTALALNEEVNIARKGDVTPFMVKLTAYNAVPEQTDGNPHETASGAYSNPEVVAARSVDLKETLPFGTVVELTREGSDSENCRFGAVEHLIGYRVIADSMHSRKRNQLDVLLDAGTTVAVHGKEINPALALGMCGDVSVRVIGTIDIKDIPETQEELRRIVEGNAFAMR